MYSQKNRRSLRDSRDQRRHRNDDTRHLGLSLHCLSRWQGDLCKRRILTKPDRPYHRNHRKTLDHLLVLGCPHYLGHVLQQRSDNPHDMTRHLHCHLNHTSQS